MLLDEELKMYDKRMLTMVGRLSDELLDGGLSKRDAEKRDPANTTNSIGTKKNASN
jgi:hypothetical protein